MSELYIYGIMREEDWNRGDPKTIFPGRSVLFIGKDGRGAVVTQTEKEKFEANQEELLGHFEILSKLMALGPIFPIRFGTVAKTEKEIHSLLGSLRPLIDQVLERLEGKVEFDVEARWNPQVAYRQIGEADPEIKAFKEQLTHKGTEPTLENRLALGKLVAGKVSEQAEVFGKQIKERLSEVSLESALLPMKRDPELFMNIAFFVEEEMTDLFEQKLHALGGFFQDAVHFKYAGPFPPYSFTGCEITLAIPEMLNEAREILELGESFTQEEFKERYRRLSLDWHPDRKPGDPSAPERFKEIDRAGKLLERFFSQYGQEFVKENLPESILLVSKTLGHKEYLKRV